MQRSSSADSFPTDVPTNVTAAPEIEVANLMSEIRQDLDRHPSLVAGGVDGSTVARLLELRERIAKHASSVEPPRTIRLQPKENTHAVGRGPPTAAQDGQYDLQELVKHDGAAFIVAAYEAILRRPPDSDGINCYLSMLRDGASKTEILGRISSSAEARTLATKVSGLGSAYLTDRVARLPIVGWVLRLVTALWELPESARTRRRTMAAFACKFEQQDAALADAVQVHRRALETLADTCDKLSATVANLAPRSHAEEMQRALIECISSIADVCAALGTKVDHKQLADIKADANSLKTATAQLNQTLDQKADCRRVDDLKAQAQKQHSELAKTTERLAQRLETIDNMKAESSALNDLQNLLVAALDAKLERHELTAVTNNLFALIERRPTHQELEPLRVAVDLANTEIARLDQSKSAILDLAVLRDELNSATRTAIDGVNRAIQGLAVTKVDQGGLAALRAEAFASIHSSSEALAECLKESVAEATRKFHEIYLLKADARALAAFESDIRQELETSARDWSDRASQLEQATIRRESMEVAKAEISQRLESRTDALASELTRLAKSKVDTGTVDAIRLEAAAALNRAQESLHEALHVAVSGAEERVADLRRYLLDQDRRLDLLLEETRKRLPKPVSTNQMRRMVSEQDHRFDAMYARFEDQYRGSREDIKRRQSLYIPYIKAVKAGTSERPVVDLGCGRGEWLELMRAEGFIGKGVDTNRVMLRECQARGLEVSQAEALEFLRRLAPNCVGAVTSFHMIEHLEHRTLVALLDETLRVLRSGGVAIFETPNPRNLVVGSCNFYLDPTHKHPIPPELSRFLMEARGFCRIELRELHPCEASRWITDGAEKVRNTLNALLFSSQDYAVIGYKA